MEKPASQIPAKRKPLEDEKVAKLTDDYIKKEIEANQVTEHETPTQIREKIANMKRLAEDLGGLGEYYA